MPWLDEDRLTQKIIDYVVACCCKGSQTTQEMKHLWKTLVNAADAGLSMASLSAKFACAVIRKMEISSQECDSLLVGNPQTFCSRNEKIISLQGNRIIKPRQRQEDGTEIEAEVVDNDWDRFRKRPDNELPMSFDAWNRSALQARNFAERYRSNGSTLFKWSRDWYIRYVGATLFCADLPSENYCQGVLMRYRPYVKFIKDFLCDS